MQADPEATLIREIERERLRALVDANMEVAHRLHAADFQLITPGGGEYSKEQYLGDIASGEIKYLVWEPEIIDVRVRGEMAVIRYQSQLEIIVGGEHIPRKRSWHTDSYEKHGEGWQVVWSHATLIK